MTRILTSLVARRLAICGFTGYDASITPQESVRLLCADSCFFALLLTLRCERSTKMDDQQKGDALQQFLDGTRAPGPTSDDLAELATHVKKDPPQRKFVSFTGTGIGIVIFFFALRAIIKLIQN